MTEDKSLINNVLIDDVIPRFVEKVEDIINNKLWETKAKPRMHGGIINDSMEIITDDNIEIKTEV